MKSLHTLLKVAQRRMDELGVEAAKIQVQIDELRAKQGGILEREKQEISAAAGNTMFASMLPAYRMRVKQQVVATRTTTVSSAIGIYRALGGGWETRPGHG